MEAILILAGPFSSCKTTQLIWEELCVARGISLNTFYLTNDDGKEVSIKLNIKSFPAFIINNKVLAVGHPDEKSAEEIMRTLPL